MTSLPLPSLQSNGVIDMEELDEDGELKKGGASCKYIPICDVYSVISPRVTATRSKKVKASACKQPISNDLDQLKLRSPILTYVYSRRRKRGEENDISFIQSMGLATKSKELVEERVKRRKNGSSEELSELGVDCRDLGKLDVLDKCNRNKITRKVRSCVVDGSESRKGKNDYGKDDLKNPDAAKTKKWVQLSFEGVDPKKFIGLQCKVYWPLEASWYSGHIVDYHSVTCKHQVKYEDGDKENLILANERIKFRVSFEEMQRLELKYCDKKLEVDGIDIDEMMVLAASLDDCPDIEHGDVIWAKLTGHAVWPAVILDKSHEAQCKGLNKVSGEKSVLVQFFGTYDFARVRWKQVISFLKGLLSSCHLKCKKTTFVRGLEEAKMYLSEQKVPERMLQLRDCAEADSNKTRREQHESGAELSDEDCLSHDDIRATKKHYRTGYRPVHVEWRDLDKCNVCHMDEEYENNLFLQCEKCRMMFCWEFLPMTLDFWIVVHARCYGEPEPSGGALWLCNLCRPGAPESPRCCLCPVIGGAMKPTTDGRWTHLACAIWIPETCLSDIKKMEPIDGLHRVHKDRWKLLCCICRVTYGACIQCSNYTCRVAFHPLCARAAGFCLEPEDVDRLHLVPFDEDREDQCIQLLSFCRKHRPSSNEHISDERIELKASELANYTPKVNTSGCARCEPYDFHRKRKYEAEVIAGTSLKRMYVENMPYLIGGCSPNMPLWNKMSSKSVGPSKYSIDLQKLQTSQVETTCKILSVTDKYNYMKDTQRKRLAFGKSSIHGFGVFTKLPSRAGDMIIEYTGELIRRPVADRREHLIYNSLVGAGTYMFRIDDERVIDATRAGSIAHLINHSCEPNCYSRAITINGVDLIIIFSKRDLKQWEELTYDYRYSSDERLVCNCGSSRCRGFVNDKDAEERTKMLYVPASDLIDWNGKE